MSLKTHHKMLLAAMVAFGVGAPASLAESPSQNPIEIGTVNWGRDLDSALVTSRRSGKPVFVLFQEVPGCAGCQKFGREVLSHPLIVEAIEEEFLPVVVYNNRPGADAELLSRFREPAWNYQVIRFLDGAGEDILPRKAKVWSVAAVAARMTEALQASDRVVPLYLQSVTDLGNRTSHQKAAFAMHCFWTGEYRLGNIDGVVATEAGWIDGREVTLVTFNENQLSLDQLASKAAEVRCADKIYTSTGESISNLSGGTLDEATYRTASAADQKKQLTRISYIRQIPGINSMQLTKINSLAPKDPGQALKWLSPRQRIAFSTAMKRGRN